MDWLQMPDWRELLLPSIPLLEIVVRGSMMYLGLFVVLRFVLKRQAGTVGITDLLVVVLLADAAQNGLSGAYTSILDGFALVATIVFWSYTLDWLGYRFAALQHLVYPAPLPLVTNGQLLWRNMRKELITEEELMSQIRQQGVDDLAGVKAAFMEGDGRISVVASEPDQTSAPDRRAL